MINPSQQKTILDAVKQLTVGLPSEEKIARRHTLMIGVVLALQSADLCPEDWHALVLGQREEKLWRKR
jgi:hypothetical protein